MLRGQTDLPFEGRGATEFLAVASLEGVPTWAQKLLRHLLRRNPLLRMTIQDVCFSSHLKPDLPVASDGPWARQQSGGEPPIQAEKGLSELMGLAGCAVCIFAIRTLPARICSQSAAEHVL